MRKIIFVFLCATLVMNCVGATPVSSGAKVEVAPVYFAPLPSVLDFAGERVPLEYPDVSQALERELSVSMYMHSRTLQTLRATTRYFPYIEKILKEYGVPTDFKYLCMAESGLNPNISSSARAAGLWQFMASASKDYDMETGENVDLRFQMEASTRAAAQYLKNSYERYGNWTMAAASYNLGLTGVSRRAQTQGVTNYYDLFLPEETMRYVFRILSMKIIEKDPARYGFILTADDYLRPFVNYTTIQVNDRDIDWSDLAHKHGTNYKVLRILNPWIRSYQYDNNSGRSYEVKIPNKNFRTLGY
ncbi:MAG: lytic transglycosylase domain-containing protein [Mucinivorans sp.]